MASSWRRVRHHRHGPFFLGAVVALLVFGPLLYAVPDLAPGLSVILFFLVYLVWMAMRIPTLDADHLRRTGRDEDEPAAVILIVTLLTVASSVVLLFKAVNAKNDASAVEIGLAFGCVLLGWLTIHTMFALHYAHLYWRPEEQKEKDEEKRGGLSFPQTSDPGAYDFLYFAFVIGMTAQTSDVDITSTAMRRINLLHSVVSFFFNTVLVAASVNAAVALGG